MNRRRVAITGMGAICGLGHDLKTIWQGITEGRSGIDSIQSDHLTDILPIKIAGEVRNFTISEEIIAAKESARFDRFIHFALQAAFEATADAGATTQNKLYPFSRMGTILGVGMGGLPAIENAKEIFDQKGPRRVSPFFIPAIIPSMNAGLASIKLGLGGVNYSISSACASASHAISAAYDEIALGRHDLMVTGGSEGAISNLSVSGFASMKALSKNHEHPQQASRPFDIKRDGFVMGEGAGVLVLEDLEKAEARGAKIYAEVIGHGSSSDAYHITAPSPEGEGALCCMRKAVEYAGIPLEAIGYINAHGTSTPLGDIAETKAIKKCFGDHAKKISISSTKSMTGHLLGAAGGVETIFSALALYHEIIPPTINLLDPDPECDLDYTANHAAKQSIEYALNNSFGFGGTNSSLILKRHR
ncbi:MAG: beta-ketoacyl-ACP synthase II [Bdellovibrionales bacterium]|jgi:3-oxoacyl-[acyl-carrier-protein] synthase II|nr:beta-ketoacyl-ACP synthase II [Bdellovibrionales bacterium]MBT3526457.1 beta-ketoacyl-ACP synthase II [Bdellovibrionales bacterium]MBT7670025.1 beta-ketoacyl-ACP synthase II [Bdellovibrionales bacterium]MBT7766628.1 beta-ketoacyl-ACP synthase II [Bdellovibrionales bacterium]